MQRLWLILVLLCLGCGAVHNPNLPWRTSPSPRAANAAGQVCPEADTNPSSTFSMDLTLQSLTREEVQREAVCKTHERFRSNPGHDGFDVHLIEFDDQGRPWNQKALEHSVQTITTLRKQEEVLVVFFVHGWFNNAKVCNGNLSCFREMLALFARAERQFAEFAQRKPRRVVGVYAGWRGGTSKLPVFKEFTFWGRKETAHTIGENVAATGLMSRLVSIVHPLDADGHRMVNDTSSIVFIGHSFGGALLFSAVGNRFSKAIGEALAAPLGRPVEGFGDLVVLVNPAIEASPYEEFRRFASSYAFREDQLPMLLTLSSEKDWPNQVAFPVGQLIGSSQKAARSRQQWFSMIESIGTFREYQTHRLASTSSPPPSSKVVTHECECSSRIRDYADVMVSDLKPVYTELAAAAARNELPALGARRDFKYSRLEPTVDLSVHNPFMTIQVDRTVMGGHSDIWNVRIMDFVARFFVEHEVKRVILRLRRAAGEGPR